MPVRYECGTIGALAIEITRETPALLAANGMWQPLREPAMPVPQAA
jgi:hypothetical protein